MHFILIGFDDIIPHSPQVGKFGDKHIEIVDAFLSVSVCDRVMLKAELKL